MNNSYVLAMYDVRGIQNYIFRTTKLKDAIGASAIVEDIIETSLQKAVEEIKDESIRCNFTLIEDSIKSQTLPEYSENLYDIQILYIGGGNGVVLYSSEELCININKKMALNVLRTTYSLQLAVAYIPKTNDYSVDYKNLFSEMAKVKADMEESKPLGALPIMRADKSSGYPISYNTIHDEEGKSVNVTTEALLKKNRERKKEEALKTSLRNSIHTL